MAGGGTRYWRRYAPTGPGCLAGAGEQDGVPAALAGYALGVAERAAAGLQTGTGEVAAARWLDAEDATMRQALAWAMEHDADIALRLAVALAPWWILRGRLAGQCPLLREAAEHAKVGSDGWCAAQYWLGLACLHSADLAGALGYFTGVRDAIGDRPPSRALVDCLRCRSAALSNLGRVAEAADDARRSLALARELGYRAGETEALAHLAVAVFRAGDLGSAVQLAGQAEQASADIPGRIARWCSNFLTLVLTEAGELAAAARVCAAALARSREAGDPWNQARLLTQMTILDLRAARIQDAAAHLQESLQIAGRTGLQFDLRNGLDCSGYLCAATGRYAEAVTVWAAYAALSRQEGYAHPPTEARRQEEALRTARQALGPIRARAAEGKLAEMAAPWTSPTNASDSAGSRSEGMSRSIGAVGRGSERGTTPRSLRVATWVHPRMATAAEVMMTASTSPSGPSLVRSRRRISTIVATPTATVCQWSWPGCTKVLKARTTRFGPAAW